MQEATCGCLLQPGSLASVHAIEREWLLTAPCIEGLPIVLCGRPSRIDGTVGASSTELEEQQEWALLIDLASLC